MNPLIEQFEIQAQPQNASAARERIKSFAQRVGLSSAAIDDIEIAVGEAVTNAIVHGSPSASSPVRLLCRAYEGGMADIEIVIHDVGNGFDPNRLKSEADRESTGGRGLWLMRALMDRVLLEYDGTGMVVRLFKQIPHKSA